MIYDENKAIEFLRENGVEVRYIPVAYMTSSKNSVKYVLGEQFEQNHFTEPVEQLSIQNAVERVIRQNQIKERVQNDTLRTM